MLYVSFNGGGRRGFTILEILVSVAILNIVLLALFTLLNVTGTTFRRTSGSLETFAAARAGFDALTQTLQRATLLSYIGYDDPAAPTTYGLKSDLHFLCGQQSDLGLTQTGMSSSGAVFFQAPLGLAEGSDLNSANELLCATGFFLAWGEPPSRFHCSLDGIPRRIGGNFPSGNVYRRSRPDPDRR